MVYIQLNHFTEITHETLKMNIPGRTDKVVQYKVIKFSS